MNDLANIDDNFLASLGLGHLNEDEKQEVVNKIQSALESRVAIKITQGLTEGQVNEFNNLLSGDNPQPVMEWMEKFIPNYRDVVKAELDGVVDQVKHNNLSFIQRL